MDGFIASNSSTLILVSIALGVVALVVSLILSFKLSKLTEPLRVMAELREDLGARESFAKLIGGVDDNRELIGRQAEQIKSIIDKLEDCYAGMGIVKYNAFDDIGGNQSYSICLLSRNKNGFLLSNLVARNSARGYSIEIKNGAPSRELSNEESEALEYAIRSLDL